jgi:hypothetical protein
MDPEDIDVDDTLPVMMGGLSSADALKSYQQQQGLVEAQMRSNMAALTKARDDLRAQRTGPSSAERLLAIAAALGQPTRTGSFGETLGNLGAVLGSQEKTKREAAAQNAALAEKYGMQIGNEQLRLLMQGQAGTGQMLRAALANEAAQARAAGKGGAGVFVGADFVPRSKGTGVAIKEAPSAKVYELQDYINDPEQTPEDKRAALRNFDSTYGFGAAQMYLGGK